MIVLVNLNLLSSLYVHYTKSFRMKIKWVEDKEKNCIDILSENIQCHQVECAFDFH